MFVETNIRHVIWIHTINFFLHLAEYNSPIPSSNGNKKLTNVSQLFLNLSPHSLIYSSANMRQLLPTAVASLGNRIIELITCARWINGSVHDFLSTPKESNFLRTVHYFNSPRHRTRKEQRQTRSNIHSSTKSSYHRYRFTNIESCEASNVFKHVQTSVQASTFFVKILISAITLLLPSSNETHTWMIENRIKKGIKWDILVLYMDKNVVWKRRTR